MGNIDELSRTLGEMQADILHIRKSTDAIDTKVDRAHENVIALKSSAKQAHKRLDDIYPHVEDYKKMKQRGYGIIAVMGVIFGSAGGILIKALKLFAG